MKSKGGSSYAAAGVDIDEMMHALSQVKAMVKRTAGKDVRSDIGSFGGLFASPGSGKLLVASTDGVGTKLKVAVMSGRHDTVGQDLVNHCANDILAQGAKPLFFLDYLGAARLEAAVFRQVVSGLCKACRQNGCALLGGETAEMPGLYPRGEYDLVGTIVGAVDRRRLVTGRSIRPGDRIIGLRSNGLHTNGYSLARRVVFKRMKLGVHDRFPGTRRTVAQVLLAVHRSYLRPVAALLDAVPVRGMAHITGGGLVDNVPRVLPAGTSACVDPAAWRVPPLFEVLRENGNVPPDEMWRVFNMGIGFVVFVRPSDEEKALTCLRGRGCRPVTMGSVTEGDCTVRFR